MDLLNQAKVNYILEFPDGSQGSFDDASNIARVTIQKKQAPQGGLRFPRNLDFSFDYSSEPQSNGYEFLVLLWLGFLLFR